MPILAALARDDRAPDGDDMTTTWPLTAATCLALALAACAGTTSASQDTVSSTGDSQTATDATTSNDRRSRVAVVMELNTNHRDRDRGHINGDIVVDDDEVDRPTMYPPPSIVVTNSRRRSTRTISWEWRGGMNDDWMRVDAHSSRSLSGVDDTCYGGKVGRRRARRTRRCDDDVEDDASWRFPHEIDICRISTIHPTGRSTDVVDEGVSFVDNEGGIDGHIDGRRLVVVYDFGREMLGKIRVSMTAPDAHAPTLAIRVGETHAEAMNDAVEHFEQCIDVSYSLGGDDVDDDPSTTDNTEEGRDPDNGEGYGGERIRDEDDDEDDVNAVCDSVRRHTHVWISDHLLAFRYVRVIVDPREGDESPSPSLNDVAVVCLAHMPQLRMCGTFACDSGTDTSAKEEEKNLDSRIWQTAVYTLQLCTHQNFVVDGERARSNIGRNPSFRFIV